MASPPAPSACDGVDGIYKRSATDGPQPKPAACAETGANRPHYHGMPSTPRSRPLGPGSTGIRGDVAFNPNDAKTHGRPDEI
jgi:hypothetical protein